MRHCFEVLCLIIFAEELDEVQRHQGLLSELQKLAGDGTRKIHIDTLFTARDIASLIWCFICFSWN